MCFAFTSGIPPNTTQKNTPITILLDDLIVTDSDNTYPNDFTLEISSGDNYTVDDNVITPDNNFVGTLTAPISVHDGIDSSPLYSIEIEVSQASSDEILNDPNGFKIYPNPVVDYINIEINNNKLGFLSINLISIDGALIKKESFQKGSETFNEKMSLSGIKPGVYIVEVILSDNSTQQRRIIVK
jgi:hypothetical protein